MSSSSIDHVTPSVRPVIRLSILPFVRNVLLCFKFTNLFDLAQSTWLCLYWPPNIVKWKFVKVYVWCRKFEPKVWLWSWSFSSKLRCDLEFKALDKRLTLKPEVKVLFKGLKFNVLSKSLKSNVLGKRSWNLKIWDLKLKFKIWRWSLKLKFAADFEKCLSSQ